MFFPGGSASRGVCLWWDLYASGEREIDLLLAFWLNVAFCYGLLVWPSVMAFWLKVAFCYGLLVHPLYPPPPYCHLVLSTKVISTHPTGMHSCFTCVTIMSFLIMSVRIRQATLLQIRIYLGTYYHLDLLCFIVNLILFDFGSLITYKPHSLFSQEATVSGVRIVRKDSTLFTTTTIIWLNTKVRILPVPNPTI